jgi:hypothetical protein
MAILITLSGAGEEAKTVGVGLSPGDGSYSQPYWYVTPWPYPPQDDLPALTAGIWHREGWIGAILLAEAVPELTSDIAQKTLKGFLDEAVSACCVLLT